MDRDSDWKHDCRSLEGEIESTRPYVANSWTVFHRNREDRREVAKQGTRVKECEGGVDPAGSFVDWWNDMDFPLVKNEGDYLKDSVRPSGWGLNLNCKDLAE